MDRPEATSTLVCLAFCGGGTGAYRPWTDHLKPDSDLALICYPGREGRFSEPFAEDWDALAADTADAVRAAVATAPTTRFRLFGHSMGGWMAFDVAVRLQRTGLLPTDLVVSSCNGAHRGVTDIDRFPGGSDSDATLLDWMQVSGSLPAYVAADPDMREMAVELMRADVAVRDAYRPRPCRKVDVPLRVLRGAEDPVIDPDVVAQWSTVTTGPVSSDVLPGGHFYTPEVWRDLPHHFLTVPNC